MPDLTVTLIQTALAWEEIDANLAMLDARLDAISEPTRLIVLPEMFSTGFSMNATQCAETMDDRAVGWLRAKATAKGVHIAGSLMIKDQERYYNRLVWAHPDGAITTYDKKHLFRYAGEEKIYAAGLKRVTLEIDDWRIRPFICYDLRFPIWCRNLNKAYDLAIFVANWPARRAAHWKALLRARAIENQAYVIGVNRVGEDGNGHAYDGDSAVITPTGDYLFEKHADACVFTLQLSRKALDDYRATFPAWMDADGEMLR